MKVFISLIIIFLLGLSANAKVLQGGVSENWTVDKARDEAFRNIEMVKNLSDNNPIDMHYEENQSLKGTNTNKIGKRKISFFENTVLGYFAYSVHEDNSLKTYFYNPSGQLIQVGFEDKETYPNKFYKYDYPSGKLTMVALDISETESFLFTASGQLTGHWIGNKCYDARGNLFINRQQTYY